MENTRENVVKLLRAMADNNHSLADSYKDDPEFSSLMRIQAIDYEVAIWLLTEPEYFNDIWKIHMKEEN